MPLFVVEDLLRGCLPRTRLRLVHCALALVFAIALGWVGASPAFASSPIVTRFAGNGSYGAPVPGPATSSSLSYPNDAAVDSSGNVYIADTYNNVVEKVTPSGTLSILAGVVGQSGTPTPGPATNSKLYYPYAVTVDSRGNVYIANYGGDGVDKVTPSGTLSIVAGDGSSGTPVPGPATSSPLGNYIYGMAVDSSGNLYIADHDNGVVEKVTPGGTLSIFAGNGSYGVPVPGPATSSPLSYPYNVAVDPSGNVYIADTYNDVVEKVTPSGTLSIFAGNGSYGPPTPGPATSSDLEEVDAVGVDPSGNVYIGTYEDCRFDEVTPDGTLSLYAGTGTCNSGQVTYGGPATSTSLANSYGIAADGDAIFIADTNNNTIDRIGLTTPGPPGQPVLTPGDGQAQMSFTPPADPGTSAVSSYQVSLDGGATWTTITTNPGPNGTLTATLTDLSDGTTYNVIVRAVNSTGPGASSPSGSVTPQSPAPQNTSPPAISGAAGVGKPLSCSAGSWTGAGRYTYQWERDGTPIPSATGPTYTPTSADQGHTLTCTVAAYSSSGGSSRATSAGVLIPIVNVSLCPKPSGGLSRTHLGPVWLGMIRARARQRLPRFQVYTLYTDNFCLAGGAGIRVGYETRHVLRKLPGHPHANGIVLALTANRYYAIDEIRPGSSLRAAAIRLAVGNPIHWGPNWWYVIPGRAASWVLKVRHGIVQEIGIASNRLTGTRADATWLLASF